MSSNIKTEDDYYDGPPPPDEITSNKPQLPANRITPSKATTTESIVIALPKPASSCFCTSSSQSQLKNTDVAHEQFVEKPFVVSKLTSNKELETKERNLTIQVNGLVAYSKVSDDPRRQHIASELLESDLLFLEIKEIEDNDTEPVYEVFGEGEPLCRDHADISAEWKINNNCDSCYADCCDEWRFGQYCVSAVKRYWNENSKNATIKDAYTTFAAHYNRVLDWHSYGEGDTHALRPSKLTKPPHCMRKGSLLFSIQWIKWKIENDESEIEFYNEMRKRRKLDELDKQREQQQRKKEFKTRKSSYRYGRRKTF